MTNNKNTAICWFRQDLRLADNPALQAACDHGRVLPIYILDNQNCHEFSKGGASRWWLHHSLLKLNESLNGQLSVYQGDPLSILEDLVSGHSATALFWNRCYEPWRIRRDKAIKDTLQTAEVEVQSFNGSLLWEPWQVAKADGSPYKVFTPFYRRGCLNQRPPRLPEPAPSNIDLYLDTTNTINTTTIEDLELLPKIRWDKKIKAHWNIGETGAHEKLKKFIDGKIANYKKGRNFPSEHAVSGLSPHIHFGEVSAQQIWHAATQLPANDDLDCFQSEMGWREFSHSLLYHFPDLPSKNLQPKFDNFPWEHNPEFLSAWQNGMTGYPLVDAGMRELWQTGYIHNRVRMVVGSFLVKNLLLHWHHGERWFWDCLVDADLANNSAGWQWIAGCGADAAPYFRVFNPIIQGEKFDPDGSYTKRFIPELEKMPNKYLYRPWEASPEILQSANVKLGETYPFPIVDIKASRERALAAYASIKTSSQFQTHQSERC